MQREKLSIEDIDAMLHHEIPRGRRGAELECEFRVGKPCVSSCLERLHRGIGPCEEAVRCQR
jgi:hypothetical protein